MEHPLTRELKSQFVGDKGALSISALVSYTHLTYTPKPHIDDFSGGKIENDVGKGTSGGDSSGGGNWGGGSSGGGGSTTPSKPTNPETPSTEGYTWEETEDGYKLKDTDGEYVTGLSLIHIWLFNFTHVSSVAVEAQYLRLTFPGKYWVLVGEIRVLSDEPKTAGPQKPKVTESFSETMSAEEGDRVTLSVEASVSDGGTLSYQWYKDETPIGTDSNNFVIDSAAMSDSGAYYVEARCV